MNDLKNFVIESNLIEGITREPTDDELKRYELFLHVPKVTVPDLKNIVHMVCGAELRNRLGRDVTVSSRIFRHGGPLIEEELKVILNRANNAYDSPFIVHRDYECLHPFMDGNGRSGRALWLWMMFRDFEEIPKIGFLHTWYYQSLADNTD